MTPSRFLRPLAELVLLFLFSLPALSPLLTPVPVRSADGLLHLYRLVQLDAVWRNGVFFTRWLPDLGYGYGLPLFNYYAPLVYYVTTPLHYLGISFPLALNLSLAAAMFIGTVGTFYFSRALLNAYFENRAHLTLAALVAALAFLYAPYILFNSIHRGNLAEQWALAFAPFALWRFFILTKSAPDVSLRGATPFVAKQDMSLRGATIFVATKQSQLSDKNHPSPKVGFSKNQLSNWLLAILSFAAVMLSHNVTSFLFAPLLFGFVLITIFSRPNARATISPAAVLIPLSAFFLALTLSAFFWLPALLERDFVQIARVIVTPDFDYRFNFVPPAELAAILPRADTGRLNTLYPSTLGITQVILASAGIVLVVARFRTRRALPLFFLALAALGYVTLMLAISQPIWDNLSLLSYVQLPMRLRGLIALCIAPFAGLALMLLPSKWRLAATLVAIIAIVLTAFPLLYPRYAREVPTNPTISDMFAYEQRTGAFGTTSFGEYLPAWVQTLPDTTPFADSYARGQIPDRFVLPNSANVCGGGEGINWEIVCAYDTHPWHVTYRAFYFPGWQVSINGQPAEITPTPRTGLISFTVTQGEVITVYYAGTTVEHIAEWLSIATAIGILGILLLALVQRVRTKQSSPALDAPPPAPPTWSVPAFSIIIPLLLLSLALIGLKFLYTDRVSNPLVAQFDGTHIDGLENTQSIAFENQIELLGTVVSAPHVKGGERVDTTLFWRTLPGMDKNLSTFVHLTAPDGFVLTQKDNLHPANLPTTLWDTDAYVADEHPIAIPATLAPGTYQLRAGIYDPNTETRLTTPDGSDHILLGEIQVIE